MKIIVASKNPVKIKATQLGFESYFNSVKVKGVNMESGVSDQPMSNKETLAGARNRATNARIKISDANYWIGIEGGIEPNEKGHTAFAWIVIVSADKQGESRTASFMLPPKVSALIQQGYELGVANDILFEKENSKQKSGAVGILTNDKINRTDLYKQAVQLALIPFLNSELY